MMNWCKIFDVNRITTLNHQHYYYNKPFRSSCDQSGWISRCPGQLFNEIECLGTVGPADKVKVPSSMETFWKIFHIIK